MKSLYVYQQALIFLSDYMIRIVIFERDKKKKRTSEYMYTSNVLMNDYRIAIVSLEY